jgi:hypothetical protein
MSSNQGLANGVKTSRAPFFAGVIALLCYLVLIGLVTFYWDDGWILDLFQGHYVFFVGLPFAGLVAYFVVGTLENTRGKIEFEFVGLKFKGASGPIIMWVVVFLALVVSMRAVWDLTS